MESSLPSARVGAPEDGVLRLAGLGVDVWTLCGHRGQIESVADTSGNGLAHLRFVFHRVLLVGESARRRLPCQRGPVAAPDGDCTASNWGDEDTLAMRVFTYTTAAEIARAPAPGALPRLNPADFAAEHADLHLCVFRQDGSLAARCSLWWNQVPQYQEHRVGVLGHYASAGDDAAAAVLAAAEERLREAGCTIAIGPMNGNTWRSYRFVVEPGERPPFFLEPANPRDWPAQFES